MFRVRVTPFGEYDSRQVTTSLRDPIFAGRKYRRLGIDTGQEGWLENGGGGGEGEGGGGGREEVETMARTSSKILNVPNLPSKSSPCSRSPSCFPRYPDPRTIPASSTLPAFMQTTSIYNSVFGKRSAPPRGEQERLSLSLRA